MLKAKVSVTMPADMRPVSSATVAAHPRPFSPPVRIRCPSRRATDLISDLRPPGPPSRIARCGTLIRRKEGKSGCRSGVIRTHFPAASHSMTVLTAHSIGVEPSSAARAGTGTAMTRASATSPVASRVKVVVLMAQRLPPLGEAGVARARPRPTSDEGRMDLARALLGGHLGLQLGRGEADDVLV